MRIKDTLLSENERKQVYDFLFQPGWVFGWHSARGKDPYAFWHKHFAGSLLTDHPNAKERQDPYDCAEELKRKAPLLFAFWNWLAEHQLRGHRIVRCYANGYPYGSEGTVHTDSAAHNSFTSIYYPHEFWSANWAGETVFFNKDQNEVIGCVYPRGNRLLTFRGIVPHVGRSVSRTCPTIRITLMFKTEDMHDRTPLQAVSDGPMQGTGNTPLGSELSAAFGRDTQSTA